MLEIRVEILNTTSLIKLTQSGSCPDVSSECTQIYHCIYSKFRIH